MNLILTQNFYMENSVTLTLHQSMSGDKPNPKQAFDDLRSQNLTKNINENV